MTPTFRTALCGFLAAGAVLASSSTARAQGDEETEPHEDASGSFQTDTGATLPFRPVYETGYRLGRREPYLLRAFVTEAIVLGSGTAYYWIWPTINKRDWDFPDYATRMQQFKPTFDSNLHFTNNVLHPFAGSLYYGSARLNGMSVPVSAAFAFGTSAMFEFFLEWLEKASINDMITTPFGGVPAGEFFLHLGDYLNSAPEPRWYNDAGAVPFGMLHRAKRTLDGQPIVQAPPTMPADSLGYSSYHWHRFQTLAQTSIATNEVHQSGAIHDLFVEAQMVSVPGFLRPGVFDLTFDDGNFTEARMKAQVDDAGQASLDLWFDANMWGHYRQDISPEHVGHASMIALDASYRFLDRTVLGRRDQIAMVNLFGPAAKLWLVDHDLLFSLEGAVHPDFASIQSLPYPEFVARYGQDGTKWVLQEQGYQYAFGWSAWGRAILRADGVEIGGRALYGSYGSIDCCDRFQEKVTKNPHGADRIVEFEGWLSVLPSNAPVELRIFGEQLGHASELARFSASHWDRRVGAGLGLNF